MGKVPGRKAICRRGAPVLWPVLGLALALALVPGLPASRAARAETPAPAAGTTAEATALLALMQMEALLSVMAEEGRAHGGDLRDSLFPDRSAPGFGAAVARIYDPAVLMPRFAAGFAAALPPDAAAQAAAFYASPAGQRIAAGELAARRALLDEPAREAAEVAAAKMQAARDPRLRLIRRIIEAGDLIGQNTTGTMTARAAFNIALNATLPQVARRKEADVLAEIWAGEAQIRADSAEWLVSFMVLAYAGLSDGDLQAHADFLASAAGQALNRALFAGSEAAMVPALADLGREVGQVLQGHDI